MLGTPSHAAGPLRPKRGASSAFAKFSREAGRWLAKDRHLFAVAGLLVLGVVALAAFIVVSDHRETRDSAEAALSNLANALEKDIARNVELFDVAIQETGDALRLPGLDAANPDLRQAALFSRITTAEYMDSIVVLDPAGVIRFDSGAIVPPPATFADRDYFKIPRDEPGIGLYISAPQIGRFDRKEVVVFSRRQTGPDGAFEGIVAGSVELDYFRQLFSQLKLGPAGAISLLRTDGTLLARYPATPEQAGRNVSGAVLFKSMLRSHAGIIDGTSARDGVERIVAYRHVRKLPLLIAVSYGKDDLFAAWRKKSALVLAAIAILTGLAGALLVALRRQLARSASAERRALASAEKATRSERNLAFALDRLDILFRNSADAQFAAFRRQDGRFAFDLLNRRAEELTGLQAATMIGRTPAESFSPEVSAAILANWERCIASGEPLSYEQTLVLPAGLRHVETLLVPVRDTHGVICRLIGTARDVTERRQMEEALLRHNLTLEQRAADASAAQDDALVRASTAENLRVLGELASGIAHDFNNVLQSITGCASVMERRAEDPATMRRAARLISDATDRGASITHRLLAFSRPSGTSEAEPIPIAPLLADVIEILRHTLRGAGSIAIHAEIVDETLHVVAERNQLQTVLLNLATNARDAMPGGGALTLGASPATAADKPGLATGSYIRLWVEDDGVGMDSATMARVTEPFFTTKPVGQGTGLGLSMANNYAKEAGGLLTIDSRPGAGTVVSLWLRR